MEIKYCQKQEVVQAALADKMGGKNLSTTPGYSDLFGSAKIRRYSEEALLQEMRRRKDVLPAQIIIEDIGGGDGFVLDGLIDMARSEGIAACGILADIREDEVDRNMNQYVAKLPGDACQQIIPDSGVHFVHARSVVQYFPSVEARRHFFAEVKRILESGGRFIDVAAYLETKEKAVLLQAIHNCVNKPLLLPTREELIDWHKDEFAEVRMAELQIPIEEGLCTNDNSFFERYEAGFARQGIDWAELRDKIYSLILSVDETLRPGVYAIKDLAGEIHFGWNVPYLVLICGEKGTLETEYSG